MTKEEATVAVALGGKDMVDFYVPVRNEDRKEGDLVGTYYNGYSAEALQEFVQTGNRHFYFIDKEVTAEYDETDSPTL